MTAYSKIPLPEGATVKVVTRKNGGKTAADLAEKLKKGIAGTSVLKVVKDNEPADYWFIVDSANASRVDSPNQIAYNDAVRVKVVENEVAGCETLVKSSSSTSEAARNVAISVYDTKTLTPVHYFEIPIYDGAKLPANAGQATHTANNAKADEKFVELAVEHITGLFVTQQKKISIPVPDEADYELKKLLANLSTAILEKNEKAIPEARKAFRERAKALLLPENLDTFKADYPMESDEEITKAEQVLTGCYLRALADELECSDAKSLRDLHKTQLQIMEYCTGPSLQKCCSTALARIEYTLAGMGGK